MSLRCDAFSECHGLRLDDLVVTPNLVVAVVASTWAAMVRKQVTVPLVEWLTKAAGSGCAELRSFAASLRLDEAAAAVALTETWSNGPVEGAVNKLKLIKRSMYGRAGWEWLRARVRHAG